MATKSKIARNAQRKVIVARYAQPRAELKETLRAPGRPRTNHSSDNYRADNYSPEKHSYHNYSSENYSYDNFRAFGLPRARLREMAHRGELPGARKSSW